MPHVTSNALQRTFRIKVGNATGTAFAIDEDGKQYFVTAKHMFGPHEEPRSIFINHDGTWHEMGVHEYWSSSTGADLAVMSLERVLITGNTLAVGGDFHVSEDVFFLGYPHDLYTDAGTANNGFPVPFVKRGLISGFALNQNGSATIFIDGHNNPGFSGGPVIVIDQNLMPRVIGVTSGYRWASDPILINNQPSGLTYQSNTGLMVAYGMKEVLTYIRTFDNGAELC